MKKDYFKLYYLVNTLIANKHEVFFYTYDKKLICKRFDDVYKNIRYDLYKKNVYCIIVKDDVIEVVLEKESKNVIQNGNILNMRI